MVILVKRTNQNNHVSLMPHTFNQCEHHFGQCKHFTQIGPLERSRLIVMFTKEFETFNY
jgi:hypothetical protein